MRIVHIIQRHRPFAGGSESYVRESSGRLARAGGCLVAFHDVEAATARIARLPEDSDLTRRFGESGRVLPDRPSRRHARERPDA